jgi:predicted Rossmann-fold nucleotide-binding protein
VLHLHDKPVVVLDPHGLFAALREQVDVLVTRGFARAEARDVVRWATSVDEALDLVEAGGADLAAARAEELIEGE